MDSNTNTMTQRTLEIIDYIFNANEPVGVSKISIDLALPKATVFRILYTLEKWNYVKKDPQNDTYTLGLGLIKYGSKVVSENNLITIAKPLINKYSERINESVNLNIEYQEQSLNVYKSKTEHSILVSKLTPVSDLNCSSAGKIFLAEWSDKALEKYFKKKKPPKRTINSIIDIDEFKENIKTLQTTGLTYDNEEYEYGLFCLAAPVRYREKVIASISVSGPKTRLEYKGIKEIGDSLIELCNEISEIISSLDYETLI